MRNEGFLEPVYAHRHGAPYHSRDNTLCGSIQMTKNNQIDNEDQWSAWRVGRGLDVGLMLRH